MNKNLSVSVRAKRSIKCHGWLSRVRCNPRNANPETHKDVAYYQPRLAAPLSTSAILAVLFFTTSAFAQSPEKAAAPEGPLVRPIPDSCTWIVTTKMTKPGAKAATVVSTGKKAGAVARIENTELDGTKTLVWADGESRVAYTADGRDPSVSVVPLEDDLFARIKWVSAENFEGVQKVGGKEVLAFGMMVDDPEVDTDVKPPQIKLVALIDAETRLPVSSKAGNYTETTYVFGPLPEGETIQIPAEAAAFLKASEGEALQREKQSERP